MSDPMEERARELSDEQVRQTTVEALTEHWGSTAGRTLAARLGDLLRAEAAAELREEFENDLLRIRGQVFDIGVRAALRVLEQQGDITRAKADQYAVVFDAKPYDWAEIRERLVPWLGPGNDDETARHQADTVVEILQTVFP